MSIEIRNENLILQEGGAIVLTVDGASKGMEGNIARAFARYYEDAWEEIEDEIQYPINLGSAKIYKIHPDLECKFTHCIVASTLHHIEVIDDEGKLNVISSALRSSLALASREGVNKLNIAILSGGWRLPVEQAFTQMLKTYRLTTETSVSVPHLNICVLSADEFNQIKNHLTAASEIYTVVGGVIKI